MRILGLKNCDSCRAAVKVLGAELVDIRQNPLTEGDFARFHAAFGAALVNKRSTTWRGLSDAEQAEDPVALLLKHPTLMKRPVIETDDGALHLGWGKDVQAALSA